MSYQSVVLADTPIRYYRLGEASGTVAVDLGSQSQNGTLNGGITLGQAGLLVGDSDTAMLFDGSSGYISLPTTSLPAGAAAWSMECWCTFTSVPGAGNYPTLLNLGSNVSSQDVGLYFNGDTAKLTVAMKGGTEVTSTLTVTAGHIYYLAITYDGTTLSLFAYDATAGTSTSSSLVQTINLVYGTARIGVDETTTVWWPGSIDETAFYTYALTSTQVVAHYTAGTTAPAPPPAPAILKPRYVPRALGSTIIPDRVSQPLAYSRRALGSTIVYESRTFIPRALGGIYIPDTVMWVPRALVGTEQVALLRSLTLAGVGTLAGTFSLATSLSDTLAGVGTLTGTLSLSTALTTTIPGVGTLTGTLTEATALTVTLAGVGTLSGTFSLATALTTTLAGVGTLTGTLSLSTALSDTLAGVGTLNGTLSLTTALTTTLAGVGTLGGTLSTGSTANLVVTMAGAGTLTGTLGDTTSLSSTTGGIGTITGTLTEETVLTVSLGGVGTLSGALSAHLTLASVTMAGTGTIAATMGARTVLTISLVGASTLSGVFSLRVALSLTCAGVGILIPNLSAQGTTIQFLTATWVTRDLQAAWVTRDEHASWDSRDEIATAWKAR